MRNRKNTSQQTERKDDNILLNIIDKFKVNNSKALIALMVYEDSKNKDELYSAITNIKQSLEYYFNNEKQIQ